VKRSILALLLLSCCSLRAQVTYDRMLHADHEPQNWLTYGGDYSSRRYSELAQITKENVATLQLKWVHQFHTLQKVENTPLVVDGIMYIGDTSQISAVDAVTGRVYWSYNHTVDPRGVFVLPMLKGLAISGSRLFWATLDGHLIAVDAKNGHPLWDKIVAVWQKGYQLNVAPLVVKNKVILGPATNEEGANCWVSAYDVETGEEVWRFDTVPKPDSPNGNTWAGNSWLHGGSPIWVTGSYDPETNLTYWGTGNPNPGWNGSVRSPGDNLYSDSVVAIDTDTGKLKWFYQFTPGDEFDWDSVQVPVLVNMDWKGKPRKLMLWANRNGFFYVLDRTTGEFLHGSAFVKQNWNTGFDSKGRPTKAPDHIATYEGTFIQPGVQGGTNWYSPSYSPRTGMFYISSWQNYSAVSAKVDATWKEGERYTGSGRPKKPDWTRIPPNAPLFKKQSEGYGAVIALDPKTGEKKWEFNMVDYTDAGVLSTASDLVFSGGKEGNFFALDAKTGESLWKAGMGGTVASGPMTYSVHGQQYVAVCAGSALYVFGLPELKAAK
jgi:alcohol dehydrogenase (cytochrome c)